MTSRLLLTYAERRGGREAVERLLARAGCAHREAELRDESTWFSFATKVALFEAAAEVLDDPVVTRHAGEQSLDLSVADGLKVALRALGSPRLVYQHIVRANGKFTSIHTMELLELGRDHASIAFSDHRGGDVHRLDCEYNKGLLSVVPVLFGMGQARVSHPTCAAKGDERCVYQLRWDQAVVTRRAVLGTVGLSAAGLTAAALAAPALVPAVAGAAALGGLALAGRWGRDMLSRWRLLEDELNDRDEVAQRFTASLQDLVSELEFGDVVEKIVLNASAAVGSKEFALLVDEDGTLGCRASTGVPESSIATLVAWVEAQDWSAQETVVVEDVASVAGLATLAGHPDVVVRSVGLAPLVYRGATLGHLAALAPNARTFLPRDVDLVRTYAMQAAVALANARHFATQRALATRDPLTGLFNHREFHESVERELERSRRHGGGLGVALFDLDGFKLVNDGAGHAEGDRVLRAVAEALAAGCRASDVAFRIGGDEFALLLPETDREQTEAVAERVRRAIGRVDARVSTSVGIATWPADGGSKDVLLAHADAVLYAMKSSDRRRVATTRDAAAVAEDRAAAGALHRERLAMASRLGAKLAVILDPDEIVRAAVSELHHSFDYEIAYVLRRDADHLQAVAIAGTLTEVYDVPMWTQPMSRGIGGRVIRTGAVALVHDTAMDPDHMNAEEVKPEAAAVDLRSQLSVPLRVGSRVWGSLSIQDTQLSAFTSDDVLLVETVAVQASAALHRSELFAELEPAAFERLRTQHVSRLVDDCAGPPAPGP
jgi:diguanylate cyclase (GGDEF)-like protein